MDLNQITADFSDAAAALSILPSAAAAPFPVPPSPPSSPRPAVPAWLPGVSAYQRRRVSSSSTTANSESGYLTAATRASASRAKPWTSNGSGRILRGPHAARTTSRAPIRAAVVGGCSGEQTLTPWFPAPLEEPLAMSSAAGAAVAASAATLTNAAESVSRTEGAGAGGTGLAAAAGVWSSNELWALTRLLPETF